MQLNRIIAEFTTQGFAGFTCLFHGLSQGNGILTPLGFSVGLLLGLQIRIT
jgi:hypothetical protein